MKLTKDAKIRSADGEVVGNLNRFVLDPRTKRIAQIVFERGMLSKTEHVIPMELIDHIDDEGVHLIDDLPSKVEDLPVFEEENYIISNEHDLQEEGFTSEPAIGGYYYYPPVLYGPAGYRQPTTGMQTYHQTDTKPRVVRGRTPTEGNNMPSVIKNTDQNIPEGTVALKEGAKVISSDQKHVGDVEKVIVNPSSEAATHLLITKGLLNREKKLIPMDWVDQILEEEVTLAIREDFIDNLPEYKEEE